MPGAHSSDSELTGLMPKYPRRFQYTAKVENSCPTEASWQDDRLTATLWFSFLTTAPSSPLSSFAPSPYMCSSAHSERPSLPLTLTSHLLQVHLTVLLSSLKGRACHLLLQCRLQGGGSVLTVGWLRLLPQFPKVTPLGAWGLVSGASTPRSSGSVAAFPERDFLPIIFFRTNFTNLLPSSSFHMRFDIQNIAASCSLTCEWPYSMQKRKIKMEVISF